MVKMKNPVSLLLLLIAKAVAYDEYSLIVTTNGPVRGKLVNDLGVSYISYQGIPYAENPTGNLRFKPAVPRALWSDTLDATKPGPVCLQAEGNYQKEQMSEDCLNLNIYVPKNRTELLPVLVYVPGGEFKALSGRDDIMYGPQLFLQSGIIVITLNYRLGALGFLSIGNEEASGNAGLKDILLALQWIKVNVDRFGGNCNKITLGGNSAGAVATHYLILSSKSLGLFNQAILLSGSALGYRFLAKHPIDNALELGKQLNINTNDTNKLLLELREIDPFTITRAQEDMGLSDKRKGFRPFAPFVPCVEIETPSAVITKAPVQILTESIPQNVPILAGFNANEGMKMLNAIQKNHTLLDLLNEDFQLCIPSNIEYPHDSEESRILAKTIRQFYLNNDNVTNITLQNFVDLVGDTQFNFAVNTWIRLHKQRDDSSVLYYYVFSFDGDLNWSKINNKLDFPGTAHADELGYIFVTKATKTRLQTLDAKNQQMVHNFGKVLTNFITFGNPTPTEEDIGIVWPETGRNGSNHLLLSDSPFTIESEPYPDNLQFWTEIYDKYENYVKNGGKIENKVVP